MTWPSQQLLSPTVRHSLAEGRNKRPHYYLLELKAEAIKVSDAVVSSVHSLEHFRGLCIVV